MPRHWMASARRTAIMYFARGRKALKPMVAKVLAMRQNTPMGARRMTIMVISIIMSLNWLINPATVSARSPSFARITPMIRAKTMTWSISPFARDLNGLSGMMFNRVSGREAASMFSTEEALVWMVLISRPMPGFKRFPTVSATATARAVVTR